MPRYILLAYLNRRARRVSWRMPPLIGWAAASGSRRPQRSMAVICCAVSVAISSLNGDRVDVSRGLRSGRISRSSGQKRAQIPGVASGTPFFCPVYRQPRGGGCQQRTLLVFLRDGPLGIGFFLSRYAAGFSALENRRPRIVESQHRGRSPIFVKASCSASLQGCGRTSTYWPNRTSAFRAWWRVSVSA
jgi:hypothetical protein